MRHSLLNCLILFVLAIPVDGFVQPIDCEINDIPSTMTLIYDDMKVVWSAYLDKEPYVLREPIMLDLGDGYEPLISKTFCQCVDFDYANNKCKKFRGAC